MKKRQNGEFLFFYIFDLVLAILSFLFSFIILKSNDAFTVTPSDALTFSLVSLGAYIVVTLLVFLFVSKRKRLSLFVSGSPYLISVPTSFLSLSLFGGISLVSSETRLAVLCAFSFCVVGALAHALYLFALKKHATYLVIATEDEDVEGLEVIKEDLSVKLLGYFTDLEGEGINKLAGKSDIVKYSLSGAVDAILFTYEPQNDTVDALTKMGICVYVDSFEDEGAEEVWGRRVKHCEIKEQKLLPLAVKRFFDICFGLVGSLLSLPIIVLVAVPLLIESPGPLFFKQKRLGKNGRVFYMYKLRSMYKDAEARKAQLANENEMKGLMFKMKDDPRITKVGKFIRRTSIDELPQFFNILKGDMSLIGTRPPTMDEFVRYEIHHKRRLALTPGLTGLWQVSGRNDISDFEEVVKLDTKYIDNFSIGYDIKIIFKTVLVVFLRKGSE